MNGRGPVRVFVLASTTMAGGLGLAALAYDLFAPSYSWRSSGSNGVAEGQSSLASIGIQPMTAVYLVLALALCTLLTFSGWRFAATRSRSYLVGVVLSALGVCTVALLGGWFIGPSLYPAAVVAFVAAVGGVIGELRSTTTAPRTTSPD